MEAKMTIKEKHKELKKQVNEAEIRRRTRRGPKRELITASAGSGKTFPLTNRYIELLLLGYQPRGADECARGQHSGGGDRG